MQTGKVAKKSPQGFGFIQRENGEKDLFFHANQLVEGLQFEDLQEGDMVQFEVGEGRDGRPNAMNVSRLEEGGEMAEAA